ncbi:barstar family protein [Streptococcus cuniculi]|uniref:Barstar (barnase inhibitor) domain-containing protein n=1 Tax=Streptococcus cuniculi TaxID=1432788 RepID=A0A4Y9J8L3_9STRE|nr:barstar family protein [Streptococcus cuniculi]MBF0778977.1 barstar family protein [Streptococcus cuniculi]TFU97127.1 hypothetical protein E4T82_09630 [Streptococcus cuniculi]
MNIFSKISKFNKIFLRIKYRNCFTVSFDGKNIQTEYDAVLKLASLFDIDDLVDGNWDALQDRLERPSYIIPDNIHIFIDNSRYLFANDANSKRIFLAILKDTVKWWDGDVEKYVVEGKKKSFNVYLVD